MSKDKQVQQDTQSKTRVNKPVQEDMRGMETAVTTTIPSLQRAHNNPRTLSPADAQTLQRTIGNQALGRLTIQRKMTVGPVGDKYEQEADAVAKQVVSQINTTQPHAAPAQTAQRQEDEEELQMKPLPAISSLQRQEEEEELQMKGDPMLAGGELSGDVESSVQSAKGGGRPLDNPIRRSMETAFNADFSGVKIHTGNQSDTLNRALSARAFTSGQDVFFRSGEYNPGSTGGQELLAHELTHVVQQKGGVIQPKTTQRQNNQPSLSSNNIMPAQLQRAFQPATTVGNAHLRSYDPNRFFKWKTLGRKIPGNSEVVIDQTNQRVEAKNIGADVTWTRAVDTSGENWDPVIHPATGGYIRAPKVNPLVYPQNAILDIASRGQLNLQKHWNATVGEYIVIEDSIETPGTQIVKIRGGFKRLDLAQQLHDLTALEQTQVNGVGVRDAAKKRIELILINAANAGGLDPALLATLHNIAGKDDPNDDKEDGLLHPLRLSKSTGSQQQKERWHEWSQAVYAKIASGATDLVGSINHWRSQLSPLDIAQCVVTKIKMEGSDLHDKGLGAVFVDFTKPIGGMALFQNDTNLSVVIKPEDRSIEKSLFGVQQNSLANQVNQLANLNPIDEITKIKMETHAAHGSIIEFVQGQRARDVNNTGGDTQAMSEGIAFAFLTGMSDVHQDNVLWHGGKPYFIDADNALNASRLNAPSSQSGFSMNNEVRNTTDTAHLRDNPAGSRSAIIQALLINSTPLLTAIENAFNGKKGRVVPLYTNFWANQFKLNNYMGQDVGVPANGDTDEIISRWWIVNKAANKVPRGDIASGPGLVGEAGIEAGGEIYNRGLEVAQIKADLDQGKVPFYTYNYTNGQVRHNNEHIWNGQTLAQAMNILLHKFPAPIIQED